jgi:predicted nuclease with TOPRIM domain
LSQAIRTYREAESKRAETTTKITNIKTPLTAAQAAIDKAGEAAAEVDVIQDMLEEIDNTKQRLADTRKRLQERQDKFVKMMPETCPLCGQTTGAK